jgi:hypothetical protein
MELSFCPKPSAATSGFGLHQLHLCDLGETITKTFSSVSIPFNPFTPDFTEEDLFPKHKKS